MKQNREERNQILEQNGINTSNFFDLSLRIPFGATVTVNVDGKVMTIGENDYGNKEENNQQMSFGQAMVSNVFGSSSRNFEQTTNETLVDSDPIAQKIVEEGYVANSKLFRRWITAHTFRMLNYQLYRNPNRKGWEACMKDCFPYNYQFEMLLNELKTLARLQKEDPNLFLERTQFFNGEVVIATLNDYKHRLTQYIMRELKNNQKTYRGKRYVKLARYGYVTQEDLQSKVYTPVQAGINYVAIQVGLDNYDLIYKALKEFMDKTYNKIPYDTPKSQVWKDAFKAAGAFYSLQNCIRFNGMILKGCKNKYDSEFRLNQLVQQNKGEEWRLHQVLVETIGYNNFDLERKIKEQQLLKSANTK